MVGEIFSPDNLKLALVAALGAGYAAHKAGLFEKIRLQRSAGAPRYLPRPVQSPSRIRFEKAVLDVCGIDHLQVIRTTGRLRRLGFWIVGDFWIPATGSPLRPPQALFGRAFVHGEEPIYAIAVERRGFRTPPPYLDFFSVFGDQTFLTASNSEENDDPRRPGALRFHRLAGLLPEELYQHHRANLEALRNNWLKPVPTSRDAFFAHYRQWLAVDHELRKARDEEVRKDQLVRALQLLGPLDISPILKRYDVQRPPLDLGARGERLVRPEASASPTIIRDPERAPIRRRLPPSGIPGAAVPPPPSEAIPVDPTYGDALAASGGFESLGADLPPEVAEAHPLDLLDRFEARSYGAHDAPPAPDFGGAVAYEEPFAQPEPYSFHPPETWPDEPAEPSAFATEAPSLEAPSEELAGAPEFLAPDGAAAAAPPELPFAEAPPVRGIWDLGAPAPTEGEAAVSPPEEDVDIRISLREIAAWRPITEPADEPAVSTMPGEGAQAEPEPDEAVTAEAVTAEASLTEPHPADPVVQTRPRRKTTQSKPRKRKAPPEPEQEPVVAAITEPAVEPAPEPVLDWITEPVVEAITETAVEPPIEPVLDWIPEPAVEAITEPAVEPPIEPVLDWIPEPTVEPAPEPVFDWIPEPAVEPAPEPVLDWIPELAVDPAPEPAVAAAPPDPGPVAPTAQPFALPADFPEVFEDAPERCPHCRARTLSRYSLRCHKCRKSLLEAAGG